MNRHERRALRAEARKHGPRPQSDRQLRRRHEFLQHNLTEIERLSAQLDASDVIAVCDSRDDVARTWVTGVGKLSEDELRAKEAPMVLANMIPTFVLGLPRQAAIDITALNAPHISEVIERTHVGAGRIVLAVSSGGTTMVVVPSR